MKTPAWGTKRLCQACSTKYYDLNRTPILCPKCQVRFDPASGLRLRSDSSYKASGGRAKNIIGKSTPLGFVEAGGDAAVLEADAPDDDEDKVEADQDEDAPEDVSELGDDGDDLAEIIEKDPNEER